ncbi:unnamed protein product [Nippostrongylus brasiliensis]|uniref:TROAP n=1 Tax=Nippostrongylus brasiliensis TaxID=27835 RepID=A0A0N4XVR4_NIPBR|nr:unnamed protein product [Nippostrongylus brasiliensis]
MEKHYQPKKLSDVAGPEARVSLMSLVQRPGRLRTVAVLKPSRTTVAPVKVAGPPAGEGQKPPDKIAAGTRTKPVPKPKPQWEPHTTGKKMASMIERPEAGREADRRSCQEEPIQEPDEKPVKE